MNVVLAFDDRIEKCERILNQDPNSQIFAALAEAYRKKGDLDQAFRVCQNGLKIHPSYASAHLVMAKINLDRGLYDWADAEVKQAIELEGRSRGTELLLAETAIYRGNFKEAIKLLKQLKLNDSFNPQIDKLLEIARKLPEEQADKTPIKAKYSEETIIMQAAPVSENEGAKEKSEPTPEPTMLDAGELVSESLKVTSLQGAQFVNDEGFVVEQEWTLDLDSNTCGATLSDLNHILTKELIEASFGKTHSILIENNDHVFYLINVANGMFLFVGDGNTNLGGLRMKIGGLIERYSGE